MIMHSNCFPARGIKYFRCVKCGTSGFNYSNGVDICSECLFKGDLCPICGKPMADKKPILNEKSNSVLDYEKKYNIHEAVHLMKNHDVTMIDSRFNIEWKFKNGYKTLLGAKHNTFIDDYFDEYFGVFDLLDLTFMLVKPVEEVKEKWVGIFSHKDLCSAIVNGKTIRWGNGEPINKYDNEQIKTLFEVLSREFYSVEYLEEN